MRNVNVVVLSGNLTRDTETKIGQNNNAYARNSLAVNDFYGGQEQVSFVEIVSFGKTAESMGQYCTKGCSISVTGKLRQDVFEVDGQKRSKIEVIVNEWGFNGPPRNKAEGGETSEAKPAKSKTKKEAVKEDDQIPF